MRKFRVEEKTVAAEQLVEIRMLVSIDEMNGRVSWQTVQAISGVAAAAVEELGHGVLGIRTEAMERVEARVQRRTPDGD